MMKLFKEGSHQTVQNKCKPIKEGFKFYAICNSTSSFINFFVPDGMKYKYRGTVVDYVVKLVKKLSESNIPSNRGKQECMLLQWIIILHIVLLM